MHRRFLTPKSRELAAKFEALDRSQAVIEFDLDGTILSANANFLATLGYGQDEVLGRHHSMFVDAATRDGAEYRAFWDLLRAGEYQAGEFRRVGKSGQDVWIQASYNPVRSRGSRPYKVVKFATDITRQKHENAEHCGQIDAIGKSQAVIRFEIDGTIVSANANFLAATGYGLDEIRGRHHSMFVDAATRDGAEYREFWRSLNRGEFQAGEFKRVGKDGREFWIQATYNPILDPAGKPFAVIKYATDVTQQVVARLLCERVRHSVKAGIGEIGRAVSTASAQSTEVASASVQTLANMQAVASGAEQLSASVHEISAAMSRSRDAVGGVFRQTETADEASRRLTEAAASIGSIQGVAADVATSLAEIKGSLTLVQDYVTTTASAVEEQSAVTREMSGNMHAAAQAVQSISGSVNEIARATCAADAANQGVQEAIELLHA